MGLRGLSVNTDATPQPTWRVLAKRIRRMLYEVRIPVVPPLFGLLYHERFVRQELWNLLLKIVYREPLMRYRCESVGRRLALEGEIPEIAGSGTIILGDDLVIGRRNSWVVGFPCSTNAEIVIGSNCRIGYQNIIASAMSIRIGDNVRLASNVNIFDNPSHPIEPSRRNQAFRLDEAAPVTIGNNVWIGMNCFVMRGVTIGDNSVIAAGSIVTRSIPANCLAAGAPAKVVRSILEKVDETNTSSSGDFPAESAPSP